MPRYRGLLVAQILAVGCVSLDRPPHLQEAGGGTGADTGDAPANDVDGPLEQQMDGATGLDAQPDVPIGADGADAPAPTDGPAIDVPAADGSSLATGRPCQQATQCASQRCVDGVCCDTTCTEPCQRCDLPGVEGSCQPVVAGEDPDEECAQEGTSTCGNDGTCDGSGACRRYPEGTECAPGRCTGSTEQAASTCSRAGVCVPGATRSCDPNACMGQSCGFTCSSSADCQAGFFCEAGACQVKRAVGAGCVAPRECASGYCADGVCCGTPCTETCYSCNASGSAGVCQPVSLGQDPRQSCPAEPASTCGRTGGCDGSGGCRLHPVGALCGAPASCVNALETEEARCDGLGSCLPGATRSCGGFVCEGNLCATSCSGQTGCAPDFRCTGGACGPMPAPILHWRLDESSGFNAGDASGNGFAGTYIGAAGIPGPSALVAPLRSANPASRAFDGASRHAIQISPTPAGLKPATALTLSVWYRTTVLDSGHSGIPASELISFGDATILRLRATDIEVTKRVAGDFIRCFGAVTGHLDGNWHHIAAVIGPSEITTYLDGTAICVLGTPDTSLVYDRGADFFVGRHGNGGTIFDFSGNLDEVRIYDRALSADEVRALAAGN